MISRFMRTRRRLGGRGGDEKGAEGEGLHKKEIEEVSLFVFVYRAGKQASVIMITACI